MIHELFLGKRKIVAIPAAIFSFIFAWPILIGVVLARLIYKYVPFYAVKLALITFVAAVTLPVGFIWASAILHPTPTTDVKQDMSKKVVVTQIPTNSPIPSTVVPIPTVAPTKKIIIPTKVPTKIPTRVPTKYIPPATAVPATSAPVRNFTGSSGNAAPASGGGSGCNCSLTCTQMTSCAEAQYQLNSCGCSARDGDHDGTACDGAPLNCQ